MEFENDCSKISTCFRYLNQQQLAFIDSKTTQLTYLRGENVFKQGAFAPYILYIIDGLVKTYLQIGNHKQLNISLGKTGDFLAFSTIFSENMYNYSAISLKDSTICMIDKEALKYLMLQNPDFAMHIASKNGRNEMQLLEIIKNISYKQMRGKLASSLLYLSSEEFHEHAIFQYLTRQDIADFASISTESTIKFIKEFEKEGILSLDGKNIIFNNKELLLEISKKG
ncbi:MAG TPA: Crp/Fnr family transcriptional regulator [Bacteroidales bacterium]|nr:MAG: Crp/Fnr family transcriptional regulator [Bacteroidetes bacterium GWF2_33_38]OFY74031.1 MAG: Crp/Fnr family transcriptional regulator [Bacteroidetes bacterium RIFOXYA12_FULL_33_9]HBF87744.1 Crp/Fnr family transcriptional regulator [Bacteroidales bacterium]